MTDDTSTNGSNGDDQPVPARDDVAGGQEQYIGQELDGNDDDDVAVDAAAAGHEDDAVEGDGTDQASPPAGQ